jgi:hypothetical protein
MLHRKKLIYGLLWLFSITNPSFFSASSQQWKASNRKKLLFAFCFSASENVSVSRSRSLVNSIFNRNWRGSRRRTLELED